MASELKLLLLEGPAEREWLDEAPSVVSYVAQGDPAVDRRDVRTLTAAGLAALREQPIDVAIVSMWIALECPATTALSDSAADAQLTSLIESVQARGGVVALCTLFRHVSGSREETQRLRERIRVVNLRARRLSQATGCFVFDLDRLLAHTGAVSLQADVHGGGGEPVSSLLLGEFVTLLPEMLGTRTTEAA